jgi:flavodoxin
MKTLIIVESLFHRNTRKIAEAMASVLKAKVANPSEVSPEDISKYDLVGFGSGINGFRHYKSMFDFVERLPKQAGRKAFVFSTCGGGKTSYNDALKSKLEEKGFEIVGNFSCRAFDHMPYLGFIGKIFFPNGINVGKPDGEDFRNARKFAEGLR